MEEFMRRHFTVKRIILATQVLISPENEVTVFTNRPSHGLVMMPEDTEICYEFSGGRIFLARAGDILYLPKGSCYRATCTPESRSCYAINFEWMEETSLEPFLWKTRNRHAFLSYFKYAEQVWRTRSCGHAMETIGICYRILVEMQKEYDRGYVDKKSRERIGLGVDYIHNHYTEEPLRIPALAQMCGISPEYFRKIFKTVYGVGPVRYINELKVARAKELICSGMYTVAQAAEMSGFADMSYFFREFKRQTQCSPIQWASFQDK